MLFRSEIKEEPMEYEEQSCEHPDRSAFIAQIEEEMKQEEKFEDMEEENDSDSSHSDISLFSDIEMYEAEDEFEKELLLWRESGEADHIRKFAERSFTRYEFRACFFCRADLNNIHIFTFAERLRMSKTPRIWKCSEQLGENSIINIPLLRS